MNETNRIPAIVDEGAFGKILANAKRLADDSRLLIENERTYSAIMLAIFAIEELGKPLNGRWGVRYLGNTRAYPTHTVKKSAQFALLDSDEINNVGAGEMEKKSG